MATLLLFLLIKYTIACGKGNYLLPLHRQKNKTEMMLHYLVDYKYDIICVRFSIQFRL